MSDAATMSDTVSLDTAIHVVVQRLGLTSLKDKQLDAVRSFAMQQDTFVDLPTGYGKSIIYAILPYVFDKLRGEQ